MDAGEERPADAEFTSLFRAEYSRVARTAYLIVHDGLGAEEVAQRAFAELVVHWK